MYTVMIMICFLVAVVFIYLLGVLTGGYVGIKRTQGLISAICNRMERLRENSYSKVRERDMAKNYGDNDNADRLTAELDAESKVFYSIQRCISQWCFDNKEKDPFDL